MIEWFVFMYLHVYAIVHMWSQRTASYLLVLGIKLRSPGIWTSGFTLWVISVTQFSSIILLVPVLLLMALFLFPFPTKHRFCVEMNLILICGLCILHFAKFLACLLIIYYLCACIHTYTYLYGKSFCIRVALNG